MLKNDHLYTQTLNDSRKYTFAIKETSVLGQAQEDLAYLKELSAQGEIRFVGYEGTEDALRGNFPVYGEIFQKLNRQYQMRRSHFSISSSEFGDILLSATNANVYAFLKDPSLWQHSPLIGVEDPNVLSKANGNIDPVSDFEKAVKKLADDDDSHDSKLNAQEKVAQKSDKQLLEFGGVLMHVINEGETMNLTSLDLLEKEISFLKSKSPSWLANDVEELIKYLKKRVEFTLARNAGAANILTSLKVSGVHYMGLDHFNDVIRNLELDCTREKISDGTAANRKGAGSAR